MPETTDYSSRFAIDPAAAAIMGTDELRHNFHVGALFSPGRISLTYTHYDRLILGGAMPVGDAADARSDQADRHEEFPRPARTHRRQHRRAGHGRGGRKILRARQPRHDLCRHGRRGGFLRLGGRVGPGEILPAQRAGASEPSDEAHQDRRRQAARPRQPGDLQRALDLPVHPPGGRQDLPARRRHDAACAGLGVEHHALPHPRPALRGLSLFRPARGRHGCSISWASPTRPGIW